ncbi:PREDICTED: uncharacterized protein LOC105555985 [Vollenhovia emeryi]|uniref:uncharacterized protein LOC105555985 n=1 Tax=Vollenhovia emeryi TaxID=411798 RepID=UPI0005F46DA0|nr:PREDICTED: uncharacterized protein LOC105555985 [Vollenhovia emeryi]
MKNENVPELKKLRDNVSASLAALANLERPVEQWDDLLVYIISQKFSPRTRNEWNLERGDTDAYPTYKEIHDFMTLRIRGLTDYPSQSDSASNNLSFVSALARGNKARTSVNNVSPVKCVRCSGNHSLAKCNKFLSLPVEQRRLVARQHKCCFNCPRTEHFLSNCPSKGRCNRCHQAHHSLLHSESTEGGTRCEPSAINSTLSSQATASVAAASEPPASLFASVQTVHSARSFITSPPHVLLATAYGRLSTIEGRTFKRITAYTASQTKPAAMWPHLRDLPLADPDPSSNHPIHVLIGADLYGSLLLDGLRQGPVGTPTGQRTVLGWIISGPVGSARPAGESASVLNCVSCEDTNSLLQRFWEDESIPSRTSLTEEEERCEKHFVATHSRDLQGRYIVRLPFKNGPPQIGDTFRKASIFYSKMERRLSQKPEIASQYHGFLHEYLSMGDMEEVRADERSP